MLITFQPVLTPLLLIAEKRLRSKWESSRVSDGRILSPLVHTVWGAVLAAMFAVLVLSNWGVDLPGLLLSIIPITALFVVYISLTPRPTGGANTFVLLDVEAAIDPLSKRVVMILTVATAFQILAFGFPINEILPTVFLGTAKAFAWYYTTRTVCAS